MKFYEKPSFKEAEAQWYKKLKDEGFQDIEDTSRDDRPLKVWDRSYFLKLDDLSFAAKQSYYRQASNFLEQHDFKNEVQRRIWELHTEGISRRDIASKIKGLKPTYKQASVGNILLSLRNIMFKLLKDNQAGEENENLIRER